MENLNKKEGFSRRGFLKTAAAVGAALAVSPALGKVQAATHVAAGSKGAFLPKSGNSWKMPLQPFP